MTSQGEPMAFIEPSVATGTMPGVHNGGFPHFEPAESTEIRTHGSNADSTSGSDTLNESEKAVPAMSRNDTDQLDYFVAPQFQAIRGGDGKFDEEMVAQSFGPITAQDRAELKRIATMTRGKSYRSSTGSELQRTDTLAGVDVGNPKLDPSNEAFDIYVWARYFLQSMDENDQTQRRTGFVFKNLNVSGSGSALNLQKNVGSLLMAPLRLNEYFNFGHSSEKKILRNFEGYMKAGEMLIVLGRPGSGCSTFLKSICGEMAGLALKDGSVIDYDGIPQKTMLKAFKGEVVYNQEVEKHFPHLTVGETLEFAASCRTPSNRVKDASRKVYIEHFSQVVMSIFGLSHTRNTKVGNDFVRGVSGGERKRVSIAEMALAGAPIACWDNSTRGLDSATALKFVQALRTGSNVWGTTHAVAIYQASQAIYDEFDKAIVLYEGRQIYFGPVKKAKPYFESMGWRNPPRQTDGDFLTSVTNPQERKPRKGMEDKVPRTPDEFEKYWRNSEEYAELQKGISQHEQDFPSGGDTLGQFKESHRARQARHTRKESPYLISIPMQIRYCTNRAYQRLWNDKTSTVTTVIGQIVMALIIGSIFYGTPDDTSSFFAKEAVLFFAILLNALIALSEINALYDQRPIVEKQKSYAFYHPWTEAMAGIISDIPVKFMVATGFNIIIYFLSGLRREPSQFFIFFLFNFIAMLTMSMFFRTIAASTKTISQALALAGVFVLAIVIYTGFVIPRPDMVVWFKWISWINPIAYAFEAILVNELHGRQFPCADIVPTNYIGADFICSVRGSVAGQLTVSGDSYVESSFQYSYAHIWRNLGFIFAFMIFFLSIYMIVTELNSSTTSTAEVLVFRRGHVPDYMKEADDKDEERSGKEQDAVQTAAEQGDDSGQDVNAIPPQTDIFTWKDVVYDIQIKGEGRRLLDHVNGYVKPGTLTALMGVSGAGKTTLLDVLAQRVSMGVITGDMFVNGKPLDQSFQRKTGYVQQQDLHLETSTVREALRFSATLRQPKSVSQKEKYDFVEEVIKMLSMEDFSEAVVGVPGEGLNVEQRKLLTIGVELAAKPALLLFLDEPTSGLDSQSSWAIIAFLRKLANNGQAILCTIHQPSAILFQEFDRLLFLAKGGRTVYFGPIGENSETLLEYFESNGSRHCEENENPAEFMLEIVGAGPGGKSKSDWHDTWKGSKEAQTVLDEIEQFHKEKEGAHDDGENAEESHREFAMPFWAQLREVQIRVFQQYWRTPSYIYGKLMLGIVSALFIGFSFYQANSSQQGLQNIILSIFMITTIFTSLVQQIMPRFVTQRSLYEVRERPSKAYSWKAFLIANIIVELPYQIFLGVAVYGSYYYAIFGVQSSERQGLVLLFLVEFFIFASTFAQMMIAGLPDAITAGNIATLMFSMTLIFNGVMQPPQNLPGFWIFMYRVSPLTYLVDGIAAAALYNNPVECARNELNILNPPAGQTCGGYLGAYTTSVGGQLLNPGATTGCEFCSLSNANQFLASYEISWSTRWRNIGLIWAYILFNIAMAVLLYWAFRVRKSTGNTKKRFSKLAGHFGTAGYWLRTLVVRHPGDPPSKGSKEEKENNAVV